MRTGIATPEKNSGKKLTIPVKTRSPIEAFQMLRQGNPIDRIAGYYEKEGMLSKDFHFMDKIEKLHMLSDVKAMRDRTKDEILRLDNEFKANQINQANVKDNQVAKEQQTAGGTVSK